MIAKCRQIHNKLNQFIAYLDKSHLEWLGILLLGVLMAPIIYLGKGCIFEFHDQMDETLLSYVFSARYPGADIYEQMMCGVPAEGLKPSAILFVPLYCIFSPHTAFVLQYFIILVTAFCGMYSCAKRMTESKIIAFLCTTTFVMLPFRPVYGLSQMGVPLVLLCIFRLKDFFEKKKGTKKDIILPVLGLAYFTLASNLVLVGYVLLIIIGVVWFGTLIIKKRNDKALLLTEGILCIGYVLTNIDLFIQVFTKSSYISHREDYVVTGLDWDLCMEVILKTGMTHTLSCHYYMYGVIFIAAIVLIICYKKNEQNKKLGKYFLWLIAGNVVCTLLYVFFEGHFVASLQSQLNGMLKTFQFERFYWLLPAIWHLLFGVSLVIIWKNICKKSLLLSTLIVAVMYLPTILYVASGSIFYQNIRQIVVGNQPWDLSWENIYAEEQMEDIEEYIGKDMSEYKIACLGISPIAPLMHGFYTIDGYSNNYPLEYKKEFREIIEEEIEANEQIRNYYDNWGSRCYLFHYEWGTYSRFLKTNQLVVNDLRINVEKMREMGCEYIFSAGEIMNAEELGLEMQECFQDNVSSWRIYLYQL